MSLKVSGSKDVTHSNFVQLIEAMTLEEKIGQLLMVHFQGEVANETARSLIQDVKVGGIIYYNWSNDSIVLNK